MRIWLGFAVAVLSLVSSAPAQARARDTAMSDAYRCGVVADDRQWLDCFYGAAQPVRAALGLASAPEAQRRLVVAPPAGGDMRDPQIRDQAMADAARCYAAQGDRQWLDCYYGAAQPVRAVLGLSSAPSPPASASVSSDDAFAMRRPPPARDSGFASWLAGSDKGQVVSPMTSYSFDSHKIFTVTLANGQIWQQQSGDTRHAGWTKKPAAYVVHLSRGALGSINLRVDGEVGLFKVDRAR